MLIDALAGLLVGAAFAGIFGLLVWTGAERLNQGLISSIGFAALIVICLALDAWIATAIAGFALATALGLSARAALR